MFITLLIVFCTWCPLEFALYFWIPPSEFSVIVGFVLASFCPHVSRNVWLCSSVTMHLSGALCVIDSERHHCRREDASCTYPVPRLRCRSSHSFAVFLIPLRVYLVLNKCVFVPNLTLFLFASSGACVVQGWRGGDDLPEYSGSLQQSPGDL